jgi:hypothetical protein
MKSFLFLFLKPSTDIAGIWKINGITQPTKREDYTCEASPFNCIELMFCYESGDNFYCLFIFFETRRLFVPDRYYLNEANINLAWRLPSEVQYT